MGTQTQVLFLGSFWNPHAIPRQNLLAARGAWDTFAALSSAELKSSISCRVTQGQRWELDFQTGPSLSSIHQKVFVSGEDCQNGAFRLVVSGRMLRKVVT